jgi:predicted dehydrogenase
MSVGTGPNRPVRVAVVGVGVMGRDHVRNARALEAAAGNDGGLLKLVGIADIDHERAEALAKHPTDHHAPVLPAFEDFKAMYSATKPDVVVIATPHPQHEEAAVAAARAGIHVLCEKPIAHTPESADRIIAACKNAGVMLGMDFNQRLVPAYMKARELIQSGALGRIYRVNFIASGWYRTQAYYNSGGWRGTWAGEGGGVIMNQAPHHLDLYSWLAGRPDRVKATARTRIHEIEVENTVGALLEHGDDRVDTFYTTTAEWPGRTEFLFRGTLGTLEAVDGRLRLYRMERSLEEELLTSAHGQSPSGAWEDVDTDESPKGTGAHRLLLEHFCEAVRDGDPSKIVATGEDGLHALELGNAMYLSSHLDETVTMPISREAYREFLQAKIAEVSAAGSRKRAGHVEFKGGEIPPSV